MLDDCMTNHHCKGHARAQIIADAAHYRGHGTCRRFWAGVGFSGQSLPIFAPLLMIDVLWGDVHIAHQGRSSMSYDSFYPTFRSA